MATALTLCALGVFLLILGLAYGRSERLMARTNWRQVADVLAGRVVHLIDQCEHAEVDPACPFCRDSAAFAFYKAAGGSVRPPRFEGTAVRVQDLLEPLRAESGDSDDG